MVVNDAATVPLSRNLCIYDASKKSRIALLTSAYLARYWNVEPIVLLIKSRQPVIDEIEVSEFFALYGVEPQFLKTSTSKDISHTIQEINRDFNLIVFGRFSKNFIKDKTLRILVHSMINKVKQPILFC
jgi:hypothetical protein